MVRIARRALFAALSLAFVLFGYGLCKLHPFGSPYRLPLTALDRAIPLLPWTVWIYASIPLALLISWLLVPNHAVGRRLFLGLATSAAICWVGFALLPSEYPRELYPTPLGDSATLRKLADLRASDDPSNCFPSMHVAIAWCLALTSLQYEQRRRRRPRLRMRDGIPFVWAIAVSISTLTTKQHYVVDVAGGMVVAIFAVRLVRHATQSTLPFWSLGLAPIRITRDRRPLLALQRKARKNQWSLDDLPWLEQVQQRPQKPLPPDLVRFINHVIYVEEIAGQNFSLLARAAGDPAGRANGDEDLRDLYNEFSIQEQRHADGLRRMLLLHGAELQPPGLGCSLILRQFERLDPKSDADAILVALSVPVFETFLDAGTIPFLQKHPALAGPAFSELIKRICRDESSHLALNWIVSREAASAVRAEGWRAWWGLRLLFNPAVYRGVLATPFLALDIYGLAYRLGFDLRALLPSFGRLWRLHRQRMPELAGFAPWFLFRIFVICGVLATYGVLLLEHIAPATAVRRASIFVSELTSNLALKLNETETERPS